MTWRFLVAFLPNLQLPEQYSKPKYVYVFTAMMIYIYTYTYLSYLIQRYTTHASDTTRE